MPQGRLIQTVMENVLLKAKGVGELSLLELNSGIVEDIKNLNEIILIQLLIIISHNNIPLSHPLG